MVQVPRIHLFCDFCKYDDESLEIDGVTKVYNLGQGPHEVEICEVHEKKVETGEISFGDFRDLLAAVGRAPHRVEPKKKHTAIETGMRHFCRFCPSVFPAEQGANMHEVRGHPVEFQEAGPRKDDPKTKKPMTLEAYNKMLQRQAKR